MWSWGMLSDSVGGVGRLVGAVDSYIGYSFYN
jgi:hypothetical protein